MARSPTHVHVHFRFVTSVAIPEGTVQRPGFWRVLWELIVGYFFSLIALGVPVIALALVGVFDWHDGFHGWPLNGPYVPAGVGAILADLFCAIVVVLVSSVIIAGSMQAELRLPVSRLVVGVVVALTGVAPFLDAGSPAHGTSGPGRGDLPGS